MAMRHTVAQMGTASEELGIPCEGECALPSYPKMPQSVHPGVVTGQALTDLLEDAKTRGYAIPAVNCVTSSSINACLEAARSEHTRVGARMHRHPQRCRCAASAGRHRQSRCTALRPALTPCFPCVFDLRARSLVCSSCVVQNATRP